MGHLYNPIDTSPGIPLDIWAPQLGGGEKGDMTGRVSERALKGRCWHGSTVNLADPRHWSGTWKTLRRHSKAGRAGQGGSEA